jgi:hypothetical protein
MLVIRKAQFDSLRDAALRNLVSLAYRHLTTALPEAVSAFGEQAVLASAQQAVSKCQTYGIERDADVLRYLNLMYVLGFDFDTDPAHPWSASILSDPKLTGRTKLDLLNTEAQRVLRNRAS